METQQSKIIFSQQQIPLEIQTWSDLLCRVVLSFIYSRQLMFESLSSKNQFHKFVG